MGRHRVPCDYLLTFHYRKTTNREWKRLTIIEADHLLRIKRCFSTEPTPALLGVIQQMGDGALR